MSENIKYKMDSFLGKKKYKTMQVKYKDGNIACEVLKKSKA